MGSHQFRPGAQQEWAWFLRKYQEGEDYRDLLTLDDWLKGPIAYSKEELSLAQKFAHIYLFDLYTWRSRSRYWEPFETIGQMIIEGIPFQELKSDYFREEWWDSVQDWLDPIHVILIRIGQYQAAGWEALPWSELLSTRGTCDQKMG